MIIKVICSNCNKIFTPKGKDLDRVLRFADKNISLAMVTCLHCDFTTPCNPKEIVAEDTETFTSKATEEVTLRCPVKGCTGWVVEVDDGSEKSFYGCGECGNVWKSRSALNRAITAIVKKYSHRQCCYVRDGKSWVPAPADLESADYETLVEQEEVNSKNTAKPNCQTQESVVKALERLDAEIEYDSKGRIKSVVLDDPEITDDQFTVLERLPGIKELSLVGTDISDDGVAYLAGLDKLWELSLEETQVTDAGLVHLKKLTKLRVLDLRNLPITAKGLASLPNMPQLRRLYLYNTRVGNDALVHIAKFPKLQWLGLDNTPVTDGGLKHLQNAESMKYLDLVGTKITDKGIAHLSSLKALKVLTLGLTKVTGNGAKKLQVALPKCEINV